MGSTALFIFYSPFTAPSGSQINPSVTITFLRLNKMCPFDAIFYIIFQFIGGTLAVCCNSSRKIWYYSCSNYRIYYCCNHDDNGVIYIGTYNSEKIHSNFFRVFCMYICNYWGSNFWFWNEPRKKFCQCFSGTHLYCFLDIYVHSFCRHVKRCRSVSFCTKKKTITKK